MNNKTFIGVGLIGDRLQYQYNPDVHIRFNKDFIFVNGYSMPTGIAGAADQVLICGQTGVCRWDSLPTNGATGLPGPTGAFGGPPGATGLPGSTGIYGATGLPGATGIYGLTGLPGPAQLEDRTDYPVIVPVEILWNRSSEALFIGTTGYGGHWIQISAGSNIGATGLRGLTGSQGLTGAQGLTGIIGATGIGATGSIGLSGATGLQGSQGETGPLGGPIGATGLQGLTGAGTGSSNIIINYLPENFTTSSSSLVGVTGLSISLSSGNTYLIESSIWLSGSTIGITGPSYSYFRAHPIIQFRLVQTGFTIDYMSVGASAVTSYSASFFNTYDAGVSTFRGLSAIIKTTESGIFQILTKKKDGETSWISSESYIKATQII